MTRMQAIAEQRRLAHDRRRASEARGLDSEMQRHEWQRAVVAINEIVRLQRGGTV